MYCEIISLIILVSVGKCEWVEISQSSPSLDDSFTKKTDINTYFLTTTSTTAQTPISAKPVSTINPASLKQDEPKKEEKTINTISNDTNQVLKLNHTPSKNNSSAKHQVKNVQNFNLYTNQTGNDNSEEASEFSDVEDNQKDEIYEYEVSDDETDNYSYSSFIPYLSEIQNILIKNAPKNKKSKMNVLTNLRNHLLLEIESRMTALWGPRPTGRSAREHKDDHVDFPSNEGALLTIGFLTFAVFLIKLVLQLIQTLGNNMNNNGNATIIGRKRRDITNDHLKILSYLDEYPYKYG